MTTLTNKIIQWLTSEQLNNRPRRFEAVVYKPRCQISRDMQSMALIARPTWNSTDSDLWSCLPVDDRPDDRIVRTMNAAICLDPRYSALGTRTDH